MTQPRVILSPSAALGLDSIPSEAREAIVQATRGLAMSPDAAGRADVVKLNSGLSSRDLFMLKVGDYRVIYTFDDSRGEITILDITRRTLLERVFSSSAGTAPGWRA
jgi:mRNA-degrading endonuclease RelE of RelBE toxin-antitoxin system